MIDTTIGEKLAMLPEGDLVAYDHELDWAILHTYPTAPGGGYWGSCVIDPRVGVFVYEEATA